MRRFIELELSGFKFIRKWLGGRWVSDGSGFYSWVTWNEPDDELGWPPGLHYISEEYK